MLAATLLTLILPLMLLILGAFRGLSVMVLAPLCATLGATLAGEPVLANFTERFMPALGDFVIAFFPLFVLGAVFGRLMEVTGAAHTLAQAIIARLGTGQAILAVVLSCAILTYGGVSLFVVAFAVFPLAVSLFSAAKLPPQLIPAAIALGAFTFTMTALPGTPAIQNAIPMPYFGTSLYAAPGLGLVAAAIMAVGGIAYLNWAAAHLAAIPLPADRQQTVRESTRIPLIVAVLPVLAVLVLNYLFAVRLIPVWKTDYLADPVWGGVSMDEVSGLWALILALTGAILLLMALAGRRLDKPGAVLAEGAEAALIPLFNTASLVGFGAVIAALPAFAGLRELIEAIPGGPVVGLALSATVLAGITGSASGGMTIALDTLGQSYLEAGRAAGVDPGVLHRVTTLATGGLDALPHNGAVVTLLNIAGLTHRQAYGPIFIVAVAIPLVALSVVLAIQALI
ncbi:GntP family permease [Mesobacterium pallidum]|uniref:GntP family permease n=1 Tax=Mesobacterium pallidum TaxID=2872037 RepID=UPI001EE364E7|nr:GntP family permease [Mesobacterium pallidum]